MINKIKTLASSPVIASDQDIKNFIKIMELPENSFELLKQSKDIIKTYYINGTIDESQEIIIDKALALISGSLEGNDTDTLEVGKNINKNEKLSDDAELIEVAIKDENSYILKIAEIIDAIESHIITDNDVKILLHKYKIDPLDLQTVYNYNKHKNKEIFFKIISLKDINDKNLTYLQKIVLLVQKYHDKDIPSKIYTKLLQEYKIDAQDIDIIYNILYNDLILENISEEAIVELSKDFEEQDLYVGSKIPAKKRKNFKDAISYQIDEKILVFIDMTLFGSGKNAIAITSDGLYWNYDDNEGFITWKEFFLSHIEIYDDNEIKIGDHIINTLGSDIGRDEIFTYLQTLQKLKEIDLENEEEEEELEPDIDLKEAYRDPFGTMEELVYTVFYYTIPTNAIIRHFLKYNIHDINDEDYDIFRENILKLSDKNKLEEIILSYEENFLKTFQQATLNTRNEIAQIIGHNLGEIFLLNDQIIASLKKEMIQYRSILSSKTGELQSHAQQLVHYLNTSETGNAKILTDIIKGGSLGALGASLFGPVGVAIAVGAKYLEQTETEKKQEEVFQTLYNNWAVTHDTFYFRLLKEYDEMYQKLLRNISKQFIENYKKAYKLAIEAQKKDEYTKYFETELKEMITNKNFIAMRKELSDYKAMFE